MGMLKGDGMKTYLGIDIGGTSAKYGVVTEDGRISKKGRFLTGPQTTCADFLDALYTAVEQTLSTTTRGIGICTPGVVNTVTGAVHGCVDNLPFLEEINLKQLLEERYSLPVHISNDVNAVAMCEHWLGAGKGHKHFFCMTFGTGIGGALVIHSKVYEGAHLRAGEICYLNYISGEENLEKSISTKSVMDQTARILGIGQLSGISFFRRLRRGDPLVTDVFHQWMERIASVLASIITILDPEKIIIGGGISSESDLLLPELKARVSKMLPSKFASEVSIDVAKYSNDAGLLGAVSQFIC